MSHPLRRTDTPSSRDGVLKHLRTTLAEVSECLDSLHTLAATQPQAAMMERSLLLELDTLLSQARDLLRQPANPHIWDNWTTTTEILREQGEAVKRLLTVVHHQEGPET